MRTSILVSHNTRIQCLLDSIHPHFGFFPTSEKIRFQNCVVLKLEIGPSHASLSMIYSGELSDKERSKVSNDRPYFVNENLSHEGYIEYPKMETHDSIKRMQISNALHLPLLEDTYVFYLIRHGQALHNQKILGMPSTMGMILDTPITKEGSQSGLLQARRAGQFLGNLGVRIKSGDIVFVSDLIRTYETAKEITSFIGDGGSQFVVLPCANELSQKGENGNCDVATADSSIRKKMARENYSACVVNNGIFEKNKCNKDVDWQSIYLPFYGNSVRGQEDTVTGYFSFRRSSINRIKQQCRNTTMISMAVFYYSLKGIYGYEKRSEALKKYIDDNMYDKPISENTWRIGGTRRKRVRKTRKL
jgi:broad specificity phosphatase PhoE